MADLSSFKISLLSLYLLGVFRPSNITMRLGSSDDSDALISGVGVVLMLFCSVSVLTVSEERLVESECFNSECFDGSDGLLVRGLTCAVLFLLAVVLGLFA